MCIIITSFLALARTVVFKARYSLHSGHAPCKPQEVGKGPTRVSGCLMIFIHNDYPLSGLIKLNRVGNETPLAA